MRRHQNYKNFIFYCLLGLILTFAFQFFQREQHRKTSLENSLQQNQNSSTGGNQSIKNFREAKKLANRFYQQRNFRTFYCGCEFKKGYINRKTCSYTPIKPRDKRAQRLEWEHVVPISYLGRNIAAWKNGHTRCRKSNGRTYKGRRCAQKVSSEFNKMEADLYNLVPSIGEVNKLRENFPIGLVSKEESFPFGCDTKIMRGRIEPRDEVKGFLARIYLYMDKAYPGNNIINSNNRDLIREWDKKFPPTEHEKERNAYIAKVQGNAF